MTLITSRTNPAVKAARRLAAGPAGGRSPAFLVEGPSAVGEALDHLTRLLVTPRAAAQHPGLVAEARAAGVEVLQVADPVLATVAATVTPRGLVGVAILPPASLDAVLDAATLTIVLVQAGDPGNAGAIIRTADAAGADAVVLTRGSVDPRNPKAVRASAGSLFHLPVVPDASLESVLSRGRDRGLQLVAAAPRAGTSYLELDLTRPSALLFGSEAHGLANDVVSRCDAAARVPIHGHAESLNLAATVAVIAYEAARQRRRWEGGQP
ncbi:MAG: RNA methyltransferase [Nitriliruptorales bacterium]|nr:RNA methyltransferase [Nitriliruptorales bacterium]